MKISTKLLLITFLIVVVVSAASTIIYHSTANTLLLTQENNSLLYSKSDFVFRFENEIAKMNSEFAELKNKYGRFTKRNYNTKNIDFLFSVNNNSQLEFIYYSNKQMNSPGNEPKTIADFVNTYPNIVFDYEERENGEMVYYGKLINESFLNKISEKINVQIALLINNKPYSLSNKFLNASLESSISNSIKNGVIKDPRFVYTEALESSDFLAAFYSPANLLTPTDNFNFLIFTKSTEAQKFRTTMNIIIVVLITSGILLSLVLVLLLTGKLRKQISTLSESVEIIGSGDLDHRAEIITHDEIGKLGIAFNQMLDELKSKDEAQKDYSQFLTLINENPSLSEVSDAALIKIIASTNVNYGVLYLVEENENLRLLAHNGVGKNFLSKTEEIDLYKNVIEKQQPYEHRFSENQPVIKSAAAEIKISYLITFPIVYNKKVIGILELGSTSQPLVNVLSYLKNIHEQLAVGITNAAAFEHAEELVRELSELNKDYQDQNEHITEQNQKLIALHTELTANAEELEIERQKALESARVKSQFLATMSHELKTPLNSILGLSELVLKEKGILDKTKERNGVILRNGRRLLNIINNILEFSKLDFGKIEIESELIDVADFVKQISASVEPLIYEKDIKFSVEYPTNIDVKLKSDKSKIEHIVLNLITNAIKFTDKGFIKLKIGIRENDTIEFKVVDSGIGIDRENQEIIFEEFRQIDNGTSRKYGGAGLGLAICKRYAELLEGELSVESELNKGSTFTLLLPNTAKVFSDGNNVETNSQIIYDHHNLNSKKQILLICRDIRTNRTLQKYLDSEEYETTVCHTGREGIELLKKNTPDLITIDLDLEDMNGWEVLMKLKKDEAAVNIPVIIASILEEEDLCYEFDAFDFMFKDTDPKRINEIIANVETFQQSKITNIISVDFGDHSLGMLQREIGDEYKLKNIFIDVESFKIIQDSKPGLILINLVAPSFEQLSFINLLNQNSNTRRIPLVINISQNISGGEVSRINSAIKKLTLKEQHHPLDILKLIRKRLKLDQSWIKSSSGFNNTGADKSVETISGETILIVDDDEDTLFTVSEIVRNLGYKTMTASNGIECLLAIDREIPDLVLLDIMMPKMDGFETIKRIRSDNSVSKLPVVAMTAYAMLDDIDIIERNGFDDILTKPVDTAAVESKIENILKKKEIKT